MSRQIENLLAQVAEHDENLAAGLQEAITEMWMNERTAGFEAGRTFAEGKARGDLNLLRRWTEDETGRSNTSVAFGSAVAKVADIIQGGGGHALDRAWVRGTARAIVAQLTHVEGFVPLGQPERREG